VPFLVAAVAVALPQSEPTVHVVPPITIGLSLTFLLSFWAREMVRAVQQRRLMHRLYLLAGSDPLTGLGNRRALADAIAELYRRADRPVSVLTVDLDHFKDVNIQLGHQTGDDLLVAAARAMEAECGQHQARAFRLGGDEFAVLVDAEPAAADQLAGTLHAVMAQAAATVRGAARLNLTASIGVFHRHVGAVTGDSPVHAGLADLGHAGDALRSAQAAGGGRVMTYGTPVAERLNRRAALERRLGHAVAEGGIDLVYQPIISLPEMRMSGIETLARWDDEELGVVTPDEFIPIAEDCGLIGELGLQIMRRSMLVSMRTGAQAAGLVSGVNVSTLQLRAAGFVREVGALLDDTGMPPTQFVLELTESVLIGEDDPAVASLFGLAALGVVIAIDDFGTGYSSLSYLSRLPVRVLKLDRSITQRLSDPRGLAIARCVSDMSRALNVDVVAEGIETLDDLARVRRLGAGFGQGWLFSRPVSEDRLAEFVRDPVRVLAGSPAVDAQPQAGAIG
jgi:diguanylate cyclase (GGDEF)-like protein